MKKLLKVIIDIVFLSAGISNLKKLYKNIK